MMYFEPEKNDSSQFFGNFLSIIPNILQFPVARAPLIEFPNSDAGIRSRCFVLEFLSF